MKAQTEQANGHSLLEVIAALNDLARLSHRIGTADSSSSNSTAKIVLERLLQLFGGQRGALLLTLRDSTGTNPLRAASFSNKKTNRPFALHGISKEEALESVRTFTLSRPEAEVQGATIAAPGWLMGKIPIAALEHSVGGDGTAPLPLDAILLLGWTGKDKVAEAEQASSLIPMIADVVGVVIANVLLTERVHVLETISSHKALHEMELLKAELLATMSHELRSPLSSIKGYAATLLRHEQRISFEERHEFLLAINESSDRLSVLINRLLEMSQLETGTIEIERSAVNLPHLVREAIIALGPRSGHHQLIQLDGQYPLQLSGQHASELVTFTLSIEDSDGLTGSVVPLIEADRQRLREVLDNLLENAIIYSPDGGTVEVVLRPIVVDSTAIQAHHSQASGYGHSKVRLSVPDASLVGKQQMVEICIRDHGIGIPKEQLERIFDHFHRVDTRLTREVNGLGLGLAICKRIVALHGGMIWAESEPGQGSTFHIWLPVEG